MNPDAASLWRGPRWTLALLLACLGMLGPFAIDTCLPNFDGMFVYASSAPAWLGGHPKLAPTEFYSFFCRSIAGIMAGSRSRCSTWCPSGAASRPW